MKEIKAYIKPHKLSAVVVALHGLEGVTGMSLTEVKGVGRGHKTTNHGRIPADLVGFVPHTRVEIVCQDAHVDEIVSAIEQAAHTGLRGDGKIYVTNVETAVRISTGERGDEAV